MKITEELRKQARLLENELRAKSEQITDDTKESKRLRAEANRLWKTMNFCERHLCGWFGDDKAKVALHRELTVKARKLNSKANKLKQETKKLDAKLMELINSRLRKDDSDYKALVKPYDAATAMKKATDTFLEEIDDALSKIDDAQGMETLDLVTKNKMISLMSYSENSEANDAIIAVQSAAKSFQAALDKYNGFLKGYAAPQVDAEICDGIDLVCDFVFDGFDFTSLFTLAALSDAEDNLEDARHKVAKVDKIVSANLDKTAKAVSAYVQKAREECA